MTPKRFSALPQRDLDPSLRIGVPSIDREHGRLIAEFNRLIDNPPAATTSESFSDVLSHLGPQISAHFDNEEAVIRSCGMPEDQVAAHIRAHTAILEQYAQMNCDLMDDKSVDLSEALRMVRHWIIDHVRQYDTKIRDYIQTSH